MKNFATIIALLLFTAGFVSCETDNLNDTDSLYGTDGDVVYIDRRGSEDEDGTDGDVVYIDRRNTGDKDSN